jgi:hypothetical protein
MIWFPIIIGGVTAAGIFERWWNPEPPPALPSPTVPPGGRTGAVTNPNAVDVVIRDTAQRGRQQNQQFFDAQPVFPDLPPQLFDTLPGLPQLPNLNGPGKDLLTIAAAGLAAFAAYKVITR